MKNIFYAISLSSALLALSMHAMDQDQAPWPTSLVGSRERTPPPSNASKFWGSGSAGTSAASSRNNTPPRRRPSDATPPRSPILDAYGFRKALYIETPPRQLRGPLIPPHLPLPPSLLSQEGDENGPALWIPKATDNACVRYFLSHSLSEDAQSAKPHHVIDRLKEIMAGYPAEQQCNKLATMWKALQMQALGQAEWEDYRRSDAVELCDVKNYSDRARFLRDMVYKHAVACRRQDSCNLQKTVPGPLIDFKHICTPDSGHGYHLVPPQGQAEEAPMRSKISSSAVSTPNSTPKRRIFGGKWSCSEREEGFKYSSFFPVGTTEDDLLAIAREAESHKIIERLHGGKSLAALAALPRGYSVEILTPKSPAHGVNIYPLLRYVDLVRLGGDEVTILNKREWSRSELLSEVKAALNGSDTRAIRYAIPASSKTAHDASLVVDIAPRVFNDPKIQGLYVRVGARELGIKRREFKDLATDDVVARYVEAPAPALPVAAGDGGGGD